MERLCVSLQEERQRGMEYEKALERKHRQIADLEEKGGAVYVVGSNQDGQLGLGDLTHRLSFTVIPSTRGLNVTHVSCGHNISFAVTQDHHVYTWGGKGVGPAGIDTSSSVASSPSSPSSSPSNNIDNDENNKGQNKFCKPQLIPTLLGEEIEKVSLGSRHVCALSEGGDCFVWGHGSFGALGIGESTQSGNEHEHSNNYHSHDTPVLMETFRKKDVIRNVDSGENHNCALTTNGEVYSWGHAASGRLGLGHIGTHNIYVSVPSLVREFSPAQPIHKISCGAEHVLALALALGCSNGSSSSSSRVFSWGSGDGGRLGHGDCSNRYNPTPIMALDSWNVSDISAATWHNACVVLIPPFRNAGWVYTWVST